MGVNFYTIVADTTKIKVERNGVEVDSFVLKVRESPLSVDSLSVWAPGVDSLLYNNAKGVSSIILPLRSLSDETEFFFLFNDKKERIKIAYDTIHNFLSFECGYLTTFRIKEEGSSFTKLYIDSIILNLPDVTVANAENIKIYHTPK